MTDCTNVTRIQLETDLGRYNFWADHWEPEVCDDGRTLYLRGRGEGRSAQTQREQERAVATLSDATPANVEDAE